MELVSTKILVAILFGLIRFGAGVLPIKVYPFLRCWEDQDDGTKFLSNKRRHNLVNCCVALCQSFGGGVLFATCMLHMMPEAYYAVDRLKRFGVFYSEYPYSQLTICVGFFVVYFIEEFSQWLITVIPHDPQKKIDAATRISSAASAISRGNKVSPPALEDAENNVELDENAAEIETKVDIDKENHKNVVAVQSKADLDKINAMNKQQETEIKCQQQLLRCVLFIIALSLHGFFEGLSVGLQHSLGNIWYTFVAVSIHSAILLFCTSLELMLAGTRVRTIVINVVILSLPCSIGVIVGMIVDLTSSSESKARAFAVVVLEGLSAGAILYITFFEILNREKKRRVYRLRRAFCILSGFALMAILQIIKYNDV